MSFLNIGSKVMGKEQDLLDAARTGNSAVIEKLLSASKGRRDQGRRSVGGSALVGSLTSIWKSVNVNCTDKNGSTPLHHASVNGHRDAVEALLKAEAQPSLTDNQGCTPVHLAAWSGNPEICLLLLSATHAPAHVNQQNGTGETALHSAAQYGHVAVVDILLQKNANPTIRNLQEESPLDLAAQYGRLEVVQLLLIKHPDLIQRPLCNHSPLHLASRNGHLDIVGVLLEKGFNVNTMTDKGTALHEAALHGKLDVVRFLLSNDINTESCNPENQTALDLVSAHKSQQRSFTEIVEVIRDHIEKKQRRLVAPDLEKSPNDRPSPKPRSVSTPPPPSSPDLSHYSELYTKPVKLAKDYEEVEDARSSSSKDSTEVLAPPPLPPRTIPTGEDRGDTAAPAAPEQVPTVPTWVHPVPERPPTPSERPAGTATPPLLAERSTGSPVLPARGSSQSTEQTKPADGGQVYMTMTGGNTDAPVLTKIPSIPKPKKPPRQKKSPVPNRRSPTLDETPPSSPSHISDPDTKPPIDPKPSVDIVNDVSIPRSSSQSDIVTSAPSINIIPSDPLLTSSDLSDLPPPPSTCVPSGGDLYITPDDNPSQELSPALSVSPLPDYVAMTAPANEGIPEKKKDVPQDAYDILFPKFKNSPKPKQAVLKRTNTAPEENIYMEPTSPLSKFKEKQGLLRRTNTAPEENVYMTIQDKSPPADRESESIYSIISDLSPPPPLSPQPEGATDKGQRSEEQAENVYERLSDMTSVAVTTTTAQSAVTKDIMPAEPSNNSTKSMEKPSYLNFVERTRSLSEKPEIPLTPTGYPQPPTPDFPPPSPATALLGIEQKMQQMDGKRKSRDMTTLTDDNLTDQLESIQEQKEQSSQVKVSEKRNSDTTVFQGQGEISEVKVIQEQSHSSEVKGVQEHSQSSEVKVVQEQHQSLKVKVSQDPGNSSEVTEITMSAPPAIPPKPKSVRHAPPDIPPKGDQSEKNSDLPKGDDKPDIPKKVSGQPNSSTTFQSSVSVTVSGNTLTGTTVIQDPLTSTSVSTKDIPVSSIPKQIVIEPSQRQSDVPSDSKQEKVHKPVPKSRSSVAVGKQVDSTASKTVDQSVEGVEKTGDQSTEKSHGQSCDKDRQDESDHEPVVMRRKTSNSSNDSEMGMFEGLLRGSIIGGPRNVTSQIYDSLALWQSKGGNRQSIPQQFLTFDPVMEKEEEIDIDKVMMSIDMEVARRTSAAGTVSNDPTSTFDDSAEWEKIADIVSSFGGKLASASHSNDFNSFEKYMDKLMEDRVKGDSKIQSVGEWLETLGLDQYENNFIANGFDNLDFLGANVMEEQDLEQIGIFDHNHRKQILTAAKSLPPLATIDPNNPPLSVGDWLSSLLLLDYLETFRSHGYDTMEKVQSILWELQLRTVLDISTLGHRKRILASLGERQPPDRQNGSLKKRLGSISPEEVRSPFGDVNLFKDYTNVKPTSSSEEDIKTTSQMAVESSEEEDVFKKEGGKAIRNSSIHLRPPHLAQTKSPARKWRHKPEMLIKGCCNYTAQYLGSTIVKELTGTESTRAGITKLKLKFLRKLQKSSDVLAKIPVIMLSISFKGVKFIDAKSKRVICDHEISNIFCACQDTENLNFFAYITRDIETGQHYCHVFSVKSSSLAHDIILTLGESFEVAYQMALKDKSMEEALELDRKMSTSDHEDAYSVTSKTSTNTV